MNHDSEVIQRSWLRLLQELIPDASLRDVEAVRQGLEPESAGDRFSIPTSQDTHSTSSHFESEILLSTREFLLKFGDIPIVQDRFHALLKHRLQTEIQLKPPLFPWETEIHDYEAAVPHDVLMSDAVPAVPNLSEPVANQKVPVWLRQLKNFNLPVAVPETVLAQLLHRCQDTINSSLLEGAKLVRAVEDLFPEQSQALNHLAGLVMTSPARSGAITAPQAGANYPSSYDAAVPAQQMVLSLLAAREILSALTLTVSSSQPQVERQWLTELGMLTLTVEYDSASAKLRVQGNLPCGGSLKLWDDPVQSSDLNHFADAQRSTAGYLSVELFDLLPSQSYALEVRLAADASPLVFSIDLKG